MRRRDCSACPCGFPTSTLFHYVGPGGLTRRGSCSPAKYTWVNDDRARLSSMTPGGPVLFPRANALPSGRPNNGRAVRSSCALTHRQSARTHQADVRLAGSCAAATEAMTSLTRRPRTGRAREGACQNRPVPALAILQSNHRRRGRSHLAQDCRKLVVQQVVSYLGYAGRGADALGKEACGPSRRNQPVACILALRVGPELVEIGHKTVAIDPVPTSPLDNPAQHLAALKSTQRRTVFCAGKVCV